MTLGWRGRCNGLRTVPVLFQRDSSECATTCLAMVLGAYGLPNAQAYLRGRAKVTARGVDLATLARLVRQFGFVAEGIHAHPGALPELPLPLIAHVDGNHYVVVTRAKDGVLVIHDPSFGRAQVSADVFAARASGVFLLMRPGDAGIDAGTIRSAIGEQRQRDRKLWHEFYLPPTRSVGLLVGVAVALSLVLQLLGLVLPLSTQWFVDAFTAGRQRAEVLRYAIALGMAGVAQLGVSATRSMVLLRAQIRWERAFFARVLAHFVTLSPRTFDAYRKEDFLIRLQSNETLRRLFSAANLQSVLDVFLVIGYIGVLFVYTVPLAALATVSVLATMLLAGVFGSRTRTAQRRSLYESVRMAGSLTDTMNGMTTTKLLAIERARFDHWQHRHESTLAATAQSHRLSFVMQWCLQTVAIGAQVGVYAGAIYLAFAHRLSVGQFVAFSTIFMLVLARTQSLSDVWLFLSEVQVALARLNDLLLQTPEMTMSLAHDAASRVHPALVQGATIECRDISYWYDLSSSPVVEHVCCHFAVGTRIGVVGRNGSGKSTLLKVIAGLYTDYTGQLLIGGVDAHAYDRQQLRRTVAMIPQDAYVFEGSVRANLLVASPQASDGDLARAIEFAELGTFIRSSGMRLDHPVLPGGVNLSGGQRLRLAFARLFLLNPAVIVLDEATSALDAEAESSVLSTLAREFHGRTIICAAHRLNTVAHADRILVLDAGRLVEDGTHDTLLRSAGVYSRLSDAFHGRVAR